MADFISREAVISEFCDDCMDKEWCKSNGESCSRIKNINAVPASDVRPVVRAFWVGKMDGVGICSNCKRLDHIDPLATHCRYCGADMREPNLDATKGDSHD